MMNIGNKHKHRGCHSELLAVLWLLEQGWEVFRNVSQHGPADLTVWNPTTAEIRLVDVKTVHTKRYKKKTGGETTTHFVTVRKSQCPQVTLLFVYSDGRVSWECPKVYDGKAK